MRRLRKMTETVLAIAALGVMSAAHAATTDPTLHTELQRVAQRKILFGHQSVGVNLLDGMQQLAKAADVPLRIVEVKSASEINGAMLAHTFIAENEHPLQKLQSFDLALGAKAAGVDIAFMKFCFVDFTPDTDAKDLFARYRAKIDELRVKHPGTTFVHLTTPLHIVEGGPVARLKYWLGLAPLYGTLENLRREEYNELLRKTYQGHEPVFDLARIESTAPDGSQEAVKWQGKIIPVMFAGYTDDGGHLNENGKLRSARELISVLASIPNHTPAN